MIEKSLFSVLMANYNNAPYLSEAIESVLKQSYQNWEIILVDDASTDNSIDTIKKYIEDSRIHLITNKRNQGCGYSKHKAVANANGEICGFLDPDDALHQDALQILVQKHMENPDKAIIHSTHYTCNEKLEIIGQPSWTGSIPKGISQMCAPHDHTISHFATFKKKNYQMTDGINPKLESAVDQDLYYKLEETGDALFVNKPLYYYRHHEKGISLFDNFSKAKLNHLKVMRTTIKRRQKMNHTIKSLNHSELDAQFFEYYKDIYVAHFHEKKYLKMYAQMLKSLPYIKYDKENLLFRLAGQPIKNILKKR